MEYTILMVGYLLWILFFAFAALYAVSLQTVAPVKQPTNKEFQAALATYYWNEPVVPSPKDISTMSWLAIHRDYPQFNRGFHCPCGKSFGNARSYFAHTDKCWAWGHYESLIMRRNKNGGYIAGERFIIPNGLAKAKAYIPSPPKYPTYSGAWVQHTEPICGKQWIKRHFSFELPEPCLEITFDPTGATKTITLTDLSELYPKMVKRFGDKIKIAGQAQIK